MIPENGPTMHIFIMILPIPTAASLMGSFRWPMKIRLMVSKSQEKTEPILAGMEEERMSRRMREGGVDDIY